MQTWGTSRYHLAMAAFIGQGPPMRQFDRHVTVSFVQHHVSGHIKVYPKKLLGLSVCIFYGKKPLKGSESC